MPVYTHNTPDNQDPCTFIKMVVTDASMSEIGLSNDWFEVDPQEVADIEELTGTNYPATEGLMAIDIKSTKSGTPVRRYGRL